MASPQEPTNAPNAQASAEPRANRLGLILFFIYLIFYAGFVYLAAFRRELMAHEILPGINLAVLYGIKLIFGAIVMALIYTLFSRNKANTSSNGKPQA